MIRHIAITIIIKKIKIRELGLFSMEDYEVFQIIKK